MTNKGRGQAAASQGGRVESQRKLRARSRCPRPLREGAGAFLSGCARSFPCDGSWPRSRNSTYPEHLKSRSPVPTLDPPTPQSLPARGPRTPGLRSAGSRLHQSRLPLLPNCCSSRRPSPKSGQAEGTSEESLHVDIQKLKEKKNMLDREISQLISGGYSVDELEEHISLLHEYNDIKDVGQMLLGKLAMIRGVTSKELYPEFGLDMND
ncbi:DNA repair protein SWI5-like protein [Sciurus carolinensis]|uniref:DNA repair protein SWI5 homolog n=1 Tax=Sciurus carolinensis TaxID=30640 RepID=A0AA41NFQ8_SCICA|nr:DNA repair protein SWI5-like protein [Sciurus carolinensis]